MGGLSVVESTYNTTEITIIRKYSPSTEQGGDGGDNSPLRLIIVRRAVLACTSLY